MSPTAGRRRWSEGNGYSGDPAEVVLMVSLATKVSAPERRNFDALAVAMGTNRCALLASIVRDWMEKALRERDLKGR